MIKIHYKEPSPPLPTQPLIPSVHAVIINNSGLILLHKREDHTSWAFPGGKMNLGESLKNGLKREIKEEVGIEVEPTRLLGIYSSPEYLLSAGTIVVQPFLIVFLCNPGEGSPQRTEESLEYRWIRQKDINSVEAFPLVKEIALRVWRGNTDVFFDNVD